MRFQQSSRQSVVAAIVLATLVAISYGGWYFFLKPAPEPYRYDPVCATGSEIIDTTVAEAWLMVDGATGVVLSRRDPDRVMYPASMTKMMTCILAIEYGSMSDTVVINRDESTTMTSRVRLGDRFIMRDLLDEMMLMSDNGAALAVARHVAHGDTTAFYDMMNAKAARLGMTATHFANPHGLPDSANYSTPRDMMRLALYCMNDTTFANIVATNERDVPLVDGRHLPCHNSNLLLERYDGCHGIKTGFTKLAGGCLASVATRRGATIYLVVMKCTPTWRRIPDSACFLDYGFNLALNPTFWGSEFIAEPYPKGLFAGINMWGNVKRLQVTN